MKILELFNNSVKELEKKDILTSRLDVKILLSYLLNVDSKDLILYFDRDISDDFLQNFNLLLNRRLRREPIANIVESKSFWDFDFFVNENVLTPRSDSEILIEAVLENFKDLNKDLQILDLGTGSGCLILTLLKLYKNAAGLAVDISDEALNVAKLNADRLGVKNVKFLKNNWNDNINEKFDLIVSNPPYISDDEIKTLEPEVKDFNPMLALSGGADGLKCYKYLSKNLKKNINSDTKIFLEIGKNQENDIETIFKNEGFILKKMYKDLGGVNRILYFNYNG